MVRFILIYRCSGRTISFNILQENQEFASICFEILQTEFPEGKAPGGLQRDRNEKFEKTGEEKTKKQRDKKIESYQNLSKIQLYF